MLCWYSFELFWCSFKKLTDWPSKPAQLYSLFNNFTNTACKFATFLPSAGAGGGCWWEVSGMWGFQVLRGAELSWAAPDLNDSVLLWSSSPPVLQLNLARIDDCNHWFVLAGRDLQWSCSSLAERWLQWSAVWGSWQQRLSLHHYTAHHITPSHSQH